MKMLSFRLEILGILTREVVVLEKVEQLDSLHVTPLETLAGLGFLEAAERAALRCGGVLGVGRQ